MNLSSEFHDSKRSGELYQTRNLGHSVINLLETIMIQIIPTLVDLAVASAYLYHLFGVYMALIVAAVVVAHLWASTYFNARQIQIRRELISNLHKEWQTMYNSMGSWQTVSYFNRIKHEQERYSSAVEAHMLSQWEYTALAYLAKALQSSVLTVGLVGACFVAAYQVVDGDQSVGNCVILLTYWAQLSGPLTFIGPAFRQISKDFLDAEQLLQVLQYKPSVAERAGAKPLVLSQGGIEFNNVHFSYDSRRQTLNGISFRALPGQTVALVGESGGGKSTILKLLFRFYDVAQGNIKIDGQDIRDITLESLRENLGMVPQDPSLFNENIISNIRYAKLSATEEDVYDACKAAAIHDKIMSFTDGYQSIVGERGVKLSGGELQRIAIARAILKNPNIVLLDEATCSVDTETAKHIQKGLRKLTAGRTTFVVAHRRSTIMKADHIIVIKNGAILEQGTHNDLLFAKGSYYNTWSKKILVGKSQDRSKNPKKSPPVTIVNDLDATAETQTPLEAFSSTPDDHGQENTQPARSQYQKQKGFNHQENKPAEDQTLPVVKHDKAGKGTLSSLRDKLWRPDVPEFIPHYLRTTFGLRGQPSNQPQVSSDQLNPDGQGDRLAGIPAEVGNKSTWKGVPTTFKDDSNTGRQETLAAQAPEDGTTSLKVEMEKKRRWRKRKSREHEESVRQTPADDKGEDIGTKAKRQRTHRRSKSRSDPTGQRRKKTDEARQTEPAIARSPDRQPASNVLRRVSAPSDPPSGETTAGMESSAGRRRRAVQDTRDSDAAPSRGTVRFAEGS
jgi:ABC-type transport system involved in Fe-S cluster assembly fused permease/ATPase subunit